MLTCFRFSETFTRHLLRFVAATALSLPVLAASAATHAACNAHRVGQFWPEAANGDKAVAQELFRCGELEICARSSNWRYRWEQLSVTLDQLKAHSKRFRSEASSAKAAALRDGG